jgi:chitin synthase
MLIIFSAGGGAGAFAPAESMNKTKGYLVFILAFTAITNLIVSLLRFLLPLFY